ncbi:uncharacterized protein EDB91DRAFT_1226207 [Suillus paluster]|uniref:uncharacterized protein n=1 Tax=Suillus paluster TaxID=48578 RepID=UPI001B85EA77|nr:uncharacterized protein EDB91DRAFT_1226207 [Suillus paluster]KAG1733235.1 hypothetical protein EDB91DRAFT_1226207 [Suillus paluster]
MYFPTKALIATTLMVASVCAQYANIDQPAPGSNITAGANFTVQIGMAIAPTNVEEIAIVIAIQSCPTGYCYNVSEDMGTVLYEGPYNPQLGPDAYDLYQDFSVQVPASFATGQAQLGLAHFSLVGASYQPYFQLANQTVYVV